MDHSEQIGQLAAAKAKAQAEFEPVKKDMTANAGKYSYDYADLAACLASVMPALSKYALALFQPVRVHDGSVVCTTMLVHESGEWIKEEFGVPVMDPADAQSIGSAATYAKRYGAQGLLGFAPEEEDDEGQGARGGAHEMQKQVERTCPNCGAVGSIMKGKDGQWECWRSKGGCEAKFPAGPFPTSGAPTSTDMPRKKVESPSGEARIAPSASEAASPQAPPTSPPSGRSRKPQGQRPPSAPEVSAPVEIHQPEEWTPVEATAEPDEVVVTTFKIGPTEYVTNGITEEQLMETFRLVPMLDRQTKKGYSKEVLQQEFKVATRVELTTKGAERFIARLQKELKEKA